MFEDLLKRRRVPTLKTEVRGARTFAVHRGHKKILLAVLFAGIATIIVSIVLVLLLIRWVWNVSVSSINQNPTVRSVVTSTKESVQATLPAVPTEVQDFIQNGAVNEAQLQQAFAAVPEAAQQAWKNTLEASITQQLTEATGATKQQLEELKAIVLAL